MHAARQCSWQERRTSPSTPRPRRPAQKVAQDVAEEQDLAVNG